MVWEDGGGNPASYPITGDCGTAWLAPIWLAGYTCALGNRIHQAVSPLPKFDELPLTADPGSIPDGSLGRYP